MGNLCIAVCLLLDNHTKNYIIVVVVNGVFMKKYGFTLAEVLITLGIIGVVASLTVPTLIQNSQIKENTSKLKKVYSIMQSALTMAVAEHGPIETWGPSAGNPTGPFTANVIPYLSIIKTCGIEVNQGCFAPNTVYKYLNGNDDSPLDANPWGEKYVLADGAAILTGHWNYNCDAVKGTSEALKHECSYFLVDINGAKKPNIQGRDTFFFWVTKNGIVPFGSAFDTASPVTACRRTGADSDGSCTAWVIYEENMDYLKCNGSECDAINW